MRGLPPEEKLLMQRIGNLMDAALNNRQASNPFEQSQQRLNRQVYPPTGLLTQTGVSSVKILWDATPSNELLRYEVEFTNLTTGLSETKTTFTNEIIYKGANGSYVARVKSVGRDSSSSTIRQVTFALGDDVMQLEGAKNGPDELGTLVQDNVKLHDGYSVYAWGSCVLDKYILQTNNPITLRLWMAERPDASFAEASLVETIILYPATESGTDLDPTARAGLISRPAGTRAGSFETSQSVMFSPLQVDPSLDEATVTFFLQAINRETEQDEVCLSLVLWSGADGIGTAVPGDPFTPDAPYIHPYFNSFHKTGSPTGEWQLNFPYDTRSWHGAVQDGYSLIGNQWTVAMWIRFDNLDGENIFGGAGDPAEGDGTVDGGPQQLLNREMTNNNTLSLPNGWEFNLTSDATKAHILNFTVFDYRAGAGGNPFDSSPSRTVQYTGSTFGNEGRLERSGLFPWGDAQTPASAFHNNAWYFMVMCFEGGDFVGPIPKFRLYINAGVDPDTGEPIMQLMVPSDINNQMEKPVTQSDAGSLAYMFELPGDSTNRHYDAGVYNGDLYAGPTVTAGTQYHRVGIWNTSLDSGLSGPGSNIGPIEALYNKGRGWAVDWRRNTTQNIGVGFETTNYQQAENLVHMCQAGAVEEWFQTKQAGRDTGYFLPDWEGSFNWTFDALDREQEWHRNTHALVGGVDRYHQRQIETVWYDNLGQSWARGTDIYDVLSPGGTNFTTEYAYAYPGQNMSGSGPVEQGSRYYPDFDEWVGNGSNLNDLPWLAGPFSPGYHKDDPDRPEQ